jgi:O-antigen/teichoic acid export membrane protein
MQVFGIIGVALGILISQYLLAFPLNLWKIKNVTDSSYWKVVPIKELGLIMALACLPLLVAIPASLLLGAPWSLFLGAAIYGVLLAILYGVTGQVSLKGLHERIRRRLTSAL